MYSDIRHIPYAYVQKVNIGFGGHFGRYLEKNKHFSWSDFGRLYVFAACICCTLETESTDRYHLSLLRYAYLSWPRYGGYVNNQEHEKKRYLVFLSYKKSSNLKFLSHSKNIASNKFDPGVYTK